MQNQIPHSRQDDAVDACPATGDAGLRVAVASNDGVSVNLHFGHADTFHIYQVDEAGYRLLETREVDKYCSNHEGNASAMAKILSTVNDCDAVFSARIGEGPAEKLARIGVCSVARYGYEAIGDSLLDYLKNPA